MVATEMIPVLGRLRQQDCHELTWATVSSSYPELHTETVYVVIKQKGIKEKKTDLKMRVKPPRWIGGQGI